MHFNTDKQTLDDLGIFGRPGGGSIFEIYDRTRTQGGAKLLADMFQHPLADEVAINDRSAVFRYFTLSKTAFPLDAAQLVAAELYVAKTDERTMLTIREESLADRLAGLVATDPEYKEIYKGLVALISVLQSLRDFIKLLGDAPAYIKDRETITILLNDPVFSAVLAERPGPRIPFSKIAAYDKTLRFRQREKVRALLQQAYLLDVYIAVASVATAREFVFPLALPAANGSLLTEGLYHPQVNGAVPNTIEMAPGANVLFLTGANMAGKSTFMKALGTALFLAHMGFPVAAKKMEFSVRRGIYTTINLPDNLGDGASHYYAEVLRIKKIAKEISAGKSLFVIFDELFRGTNVKDAYEATIAVTSAFARKTASLFVISTHIIEAGPILAEMHPMISFRYLPTRMKENQPVYTYTLESGITADRHGMTIIHNEGILELLKHNRPTSTR